jgi:hypothetical protein
VIDHRRFLGDRNREVLPYLGGPVVDARERRLRVVRETDPGWVEFSIAGQSAEPLRAADRPDLGDLQVVHGHAVADYLVQTDARAELLFLPDEIATLPFSPIVARRWPTGPLLFESHAFESGAEESARQAFEERRTLAGIGGVPSSLRAAFGSAVVMRFANERDAIVFPVEVRLAVGRLADEGETAAARLLEQIERERERQRSLLPSTSIRRESAMGRSDPDRIGEALAAAGGQVLSLRDVGDLIEVRFLLRGERFSSLVHRDSLQVFDAGICLNGADREVTIESLPSVIIEGLETGQVYMTRQP